MSALSTLVDQYGIPNLRFFIPMRRLTYAGGIPGNAGWPWDNPEELVECSISEERYAVADDYKVTLVAVDSGDQLRFGKIHFYQSDLISLIRMSASRCDCRFRVFALTIDGYHPLHL